MWIFWPVCCFTRGPQDNGRILRAWQFGHFSFPKQKKTKKQPRLTHTLQGLSRSQLAAPELLSALKGRAQQLSHVLFGTLVKRNFWDEIFGSDPKRLEFGCLLKRPFSQCVFFFTFVGQFQRSWPKLGKFKLWSTCGMTMWILMPNGPFVEKNYVPVKTSRCLGKFVGIEKGSRRVDVFDLPTVEKHLKIISHHHYFP